MNFESFPQQNNEMKEVDNKIEDFEDLFAGVMVESREGEAVPTIEYNLPYPKEDFLKFLVEDKDCLLHGSAKNIEIIEPRQANDLDKVSGNKNAVYAVEDPVLSVFYAIKDKTKINGVVTSGFIDDPETGERRYGFKMPKESLEAEPWTDGMVYIFDKHKFQQELRDDGEPSSEWTASEAVKPVAKLPVGTEDFRFLDDVTS